MIVHLSSSELNIVRYALDQQTVTLKQLLKDGAEIIVPELQDTFQLYIKQMQELTNKLPEY